MSRREKIALALAAAALALVVAAELLAPEPVDWRPSYERGDARPYAGKILYDLLPDLFPAAAVTPTDRPPYLVLRRRAPGSTAAYLFLTQQFAPGPAEAHQLLRFARRGGTVFAAAEDFAGPLADSLRLDTDRRFPGARDSTTLRFTSPSLRDAEARLRSSVAAAHFTGFDTSRTHVLGENGRGEAIFVRQDLGQGALYLSSTPRAFSNYALLGGGDRYAYAALSHLPDAEGALLWDGHYKPARAGASTPLRVVLTHPPLRAAYVLLVVGALLFAVFEGRRRQRPVPVVEPPKNETAGFVRTVGRLYFERGDHAHLAGKKIDHFRAYAREKLRLATDGALDDAFAARVVERSGVPEDDVRALFDEIAEAQERETLSENGLQRLSRRLEAFYRESQR